MSHADSIATWISKELKAKYEIGEKEHGGNVRKKLVDRHLVEELLDLVVYVAVIQEQKTIVQWLIDVAYCTQDIEIKNKYIRLARNVLNHGNINGIKEEELNEVNETTSSYADANLVQILKEVSEEVL